MGLAIIPGTAGAATSALSTGHRVRFRVQLPCFKRKEGLRPMCVETAHSPRRESAAVRLKARTKSSGGETFFSVLPEGGTPGGARISGTRKRPLLSAPEGATNVCLGLAVSLQPGPRARAALRATTFFFTRTVRVGRDSGQVSATGPSAVQGTWRPLA